MKHIIKIDGMGCEKCVAHVKEALVELGDLEIIDVKIGETLVDMPENYDFGKIVEALDDAGYDVLGYEVLD